MFKKNNGFYCFIFVLIALLFLAPRVLSQSPDFGDVNEDNAINIVDALLTAQYYVQLPVLTFNPDVADVDASGTVDIVDALLIAQFYVGLLSEFPASQGDIEFIASELPRNMEPQPGAGELDSVVQGNNLFALDCYHAISGQDGNIFFSPVSISFAFAMCYAGTNGNTETEIASTMHFTLPEDNLHNTFNALELILTTEPEKPPQDMGEEMKLHIANSTWGQKDYYYVPGFLDILSIHYGAEMNVVNFITNPEACRLLINDWVSEKTEERINDLLPERSIDTLTRLVLTNAIYFKANWMDPFEEKDTHDGLFYPSTGGSVTVPMMTQVTIAGYCEVPGEYSAVKLPYQGVKKNSMIIILPDQGQFESFENLVTLQVLNDIIQAQTTHQVDLTMPKYSYEWEDSLRTTLIDLGMKDAFINGIADFSGINGQYNLAITNVFHKAFVAVDEIGTEAAAATAIVIGKTSIPDFAEMTIDRPFLYFIYNDDTGAILFFGRVTEL